MSQCHGNSRRTKRGITALSVFLALFLCMAESVGAASCEKDPLLKNLPSFLENPAAISGSLTVTPETFLCMDEEAAKRLSSALTILTPGGTRLPVTDGRPGGAIPVKVAVDFPVLLEQVGICFNADDGGCIKRLKQCFVSKPLPAEAIPSILHQFTGKRDKRRSLATLLGIVPRLGKNMEDIVLATDIFRSFGGKVSDKVKIAALYPRSNQSWMREAEQKARVKFPDSIIVRADARILKAVEGSLVALGFRILSETELKQLDPE